MSNTQRPPNQPQGSNPYLSMQQHQSSLAAMDMNQRSAVNGRNDGNLATSAAARTFTSHPSTNSTQQNIDAIRGQSRALQQQQTAATAQAAIHNIMSVENNTLTHQQFPKQWQAHQNQNNNGNGDQLLSMALSQLANIAGLSVPGKSANVANNNAHLGTVYQQLKQLGLEQLLSPVPQNGTQNPPQQQQQDGNATIVSLPLSLEHQNKKLKQSLPPPEEKKREIRISVIPCRARGMSVEHSMQTAYFEIPEDIKHGDSLICSFPACRNKGVKFIYCTYCKDAVAKRNFRHKHIHDGSDEKCGSKAMAPPVKGSEVQSDVSPGGESQSDVSPVTSSNPSELSSSSSDPEQQSSRKKRPASSFADNWRKEQLRSNLRAKLARMDSPRKDAWKWLLANRPEVATGDEMDAWLMQVMAISDTKRSVPADLAASL